MITQAFKGYLVNYIKLSCFFWFSPVSWNTSLSKIEFIREKKRRNVFHVMRAILTLYILGMVWHALDGDSSTDLKLQAVAIIAFFVFILILTWIWSMAVSPVQLFNSFSKFEDYLIKGNKFAENNLRCPTCIDSDRNRFWQFSLSTHVDNSQISHNFFA